MSRNLKAALNEANPNKIAAVLNAVRSGAAFGAIPQFFRGTVTADVLALPEELRAAAVLQGFRVAGGATGQIIPEVQGTTPAAGEAAPNPVGNVVFAAADVVTEAEVMYLPFQGEIFEDFVVVAASSATLLGSRRGAVLLSAEVVTGVIPGAKTVDFRGAAIAAGEVGLALSGLTVTFNAADVVAGTARVRYVAQPGVGNGVQKSLATLLTELQAAL